MTKTYSIYASNPDFQWNWDGQSFTRLSKGDATTEPCSLEDWGKAVECFYEMFDQNSYAVLRLDRILSDGEEIETLERREA